MKGSPNLPNCGFSSQAVKILLKCNTPFSYVDVLEHPDIRLELPKISHWPTYPQLWIDSELIGGSDIMMEMYKKGELQNLIKRIKLKYNLKTNNSDNITKAS